MGSWSEGRIVETFALGQINNRSDHDLLEVIELAKRAR
jgi:hypothetical protein